MARRKADGSDDAAEAPTSLVDEAASLSVVLARQAAHAEHALVHEIEVTLGGLRTKLNAIATDRPDVAALIAKVKAIL